MRLVFGTLVLLLGMLSQSFPVNAQVVRNLSQNGDYDINHRGWNGLSSLIGLAAGNGLADVVQQQDVDWEELDSDDLLFVLYPTSKLNAEHLVRFIKNGGRALIADDFGSGAELLEMLGGVRNRQTLATDYLDGQRFAPIAKPQQGSKHPLAKGVAGITTNHPSSFRSGAGDLHLLSVFEFQPGSTLIAAGDLGAGRVVILSDPSILINRMLQFHGNLVFALNLLRYLRPTDNTRLLVLSQEITIAGVPRNHTTEDSWRGEATAKVSLIDRWLDELNRWRFTPRSLRVITLMMAVGLAFFAFLAIPKSRQRVLDGSWTKPGVDHRKRMLTDYETPKRLTNYILPAAIDRDNINSALEAQLNTREPLYTFSARELLDKLTREVSKDTAAALSALLPKLHGLPQRAQAESLWEPSYLSRNDFETIHKQALVFFEHLDAHTKQPSTGRKTW